MAFSVYLLYSPSHNRTYVGQTKELGSRLMLHNAGKVRSTKFYRPWELVHKEEFQTRSEAMAREKWLKSSRGRALISKLITECKAEKGGVDQD